MLKKTINMKYNNAFLLFEVLVAILVVSTALVILMQGVGSALRGINIGENYFKAVILAEGRLAILEKEVGVKLCSESGRFNEDEDPSDKLSWEQRIKSVKTTSLFGTEELPVCEVEIMVKWKERAGERNVTLVTYLPKYEETAPER